MTKLTPSEINIIKGALLDVQRRNAMNGLEYMHITNVIHKMFAMYDEVRLEEILSSLENQYK
jgi:hypothetical protein